MGKSVTWLFKSPPAERTAHAINMVFVFFLTNNDEVTGTINSAGFPKS
jgi:hypothetical protein